MTDAPTVYIVDDDDAVRAGLRLLLSAEGLHTEDFASARAFLDACPKGCEYRGCVILDLQMPDMNGLEVQEQLIARGIDLPVIFLSGHGTVPTAVQALQGGALDFIEKPVNSDMLLTRIRGALQSDAEARSRAVRTEKIRQRMQQLTRREREILELIVNGKASKVIAASGVLRDD